MCRLIIFQVILNVHSMTLELPAFVTLNAAKADSLTERLEEVGLHIPLLHGDMRHVVVLQPASETVGHLVVAGKGHVVALEFLLHEVKIDIVVALIFACAGCHLIGLCDTVLDIFLVIHDE